MSASRDRADGHARDLPPGAGRLVRLHLRMGDLLIRLASLRRPAATLGVRLVAFDAVGRVFLVRHSYRPGWHLPGGAVEPGESAREAVLREAAEEGGLVPSEAPTLLGVHLHVTTGRIDHVVVFVARGVRAVAARPRGFEIAEAGFFEAGALPPDATRATRDRIAEALGRQPPSDRW